MSREIWPNSVPTIGSRSVPLGPVGSRAHNLAPPVNSEMHREALVSTISKKPNGRWLAYRDGSGRSRSKVFDRKFDAQQFLDEVATDIKRHETMATRDLERYDNSISRLDGSEMLSHFLDDAYRFVAQDVSSLHEGRQGLVEVYPNRRKAATTIFVCDPVSPGVREIARGRSEA